MSNSRHRAVMLSPSLSRITKRIRSSITEHFLHGMFYILPDSGKMCYPCLRNVLLPMSRDGQRSDMSRAKLNGEKRVKEYLTSVGLRVERFRKDEVGQGRTPDF